MIELLATLPTYEQDVATKRVWEWISARFNQAEGICYYKHPVIVTQTGIVPELTLLTLTYQPIAIKCLPYQLPDIESVGEQSWKVNGKDIDSPILELEDFIEGFLSKFRKDRLLRRRLQPQAVLALPLISETDFIKTFQKLENVLTIWSSGDITPLSFPLNPSLTEEEWRHTRSIIQGVSPLKNYFTVSPTQGSTLGEAITVLDRQIALLDVEQEKAALQIAPGPQAIRGLAGTGKTALLAIKAARIHLLYPNQKLLFTFNTNSLYNQARTLIAKFYRHFSDVDPNWDILHIRHGWGRSDRPGVYSELCGRQGTLPINLTQAQGFNRRTPFQVCCQHALRSPISPEYDFILVDEAQDFPKEFFRLLYQLAIPHDNDRRIYFAYDELQNLTDLEILKPSEWFGVDEKGKPLVSLDGEYPGNIEKDLVLQKSYRCPQRVLMLAHAIGLGLYHPKGCVQMIAHENSWTTLGYEITSGELRQGEPVVIYRPETNSLNLIVQAYRGSQADIIVETFNDLSAEIQWVAHAIQQDIKQEKVAPEHIVVICLDSFHVKNYLMRLQRSLLENGITATIPGFSDDTAAFAEPGKVTLATVFKAKGNEAYIVYVMGFDALYDYVEAIENRNKAFTAISRSKAWIRITGTGKRMKEVKQEIDQILADQPYFKFTFPDMKTIRRLDAETSRRRKVVKRVSDNVSKLINSDSEVLAALDPNMLDQLLEKITEAKREKRSI